jgi:hypothetical protein
MHGQWIGKYEGSTGGHIILNVDELEECYAGVAYLHPNDTGLPRVAATLVTPDKKSPFKLRTNDLYAFEPNGLDPVRWEKAKEHFPADMIFSSYADVEGSWNEDALTLDWKSDLGATGHALLPRSKASKPSDLTPNVVSWNEFKSQLDKLQERALIFRGQSQPWRLRTKYHRTGRADLNRYRNEDIVQVHRHLSARTKHLFDLAKPDEFGSFCSMMQHHGYPTPMLDWSKSPYVAVFFAYRNVTREDLAKRDVNSKVRIQVFDSYNWKKTFPQFPLMLFPALHISVIEFVATENERLIPQQSVSTITNADDIETYIRDLETQSGKTYLEAYDLPVSERIKVMRELSYMGITAGSLFPGYDGACEELRERNFAL